MKNKSDYQPNHIALVKMGFSVPDGGLSYKRNIVQHCPHCQKQELHMQIYRPGYSEKDWFVSCRGCSIRLSGGLSRYMNKKEQQNVKRSRKVSHDTRL